MTTGRSGESSQTPAGPGEAERLAEAERRRQDHLRSEMERGTSWISVVLGWLSALGAALVLSGIVGAVVGAIVKGSSGNDVSSGGLSSLIGLLVTLFIAYLVGGYAAGRMASRGGAKHGLLVALLGLVVTVVALVTATVVGAGFADQINNITLPSSPSAGASGHDISSIATASGILALLLPFAGGAVGGLWGARTGRRRGVPPWESRSLRVEGGEG